MTGEYADALDLLPAHRSYPKHNDILLLLVSRYEPWQNVTKQGVLQGQVV